ncbi:hypothetical protein TCA2_1711 [Paenibacillus sp. TCA20]|uniref:DUF6508 domain-containing protein n=1 Tax=Paenibacillus urinalis TaxID=521520 RepID=A0AAX3MWW6_9BACL|nr:MULTISPECIES: DUF6508 domain-containing protein [Paenibacillus]WDH80849.1 DUF6508 domain-containing protein [Paenibacillus urinalis]GAK39223.1 hypothetical protein TCA2_1711 [Paenibacillus sp. TCA20]
MPYDAVITSKEINILVEYLPYFEDPDSIFFTEKNGYLLESEEVLRFRKELDRTGFLMVFDWTAWISEHEIYRNVEHDVQDHIMKLDMEALRKLMTSYIRGDRFNEGLFIQAIIKGHITHILCRTKELYKIL